MRAGGRNVSVCRGAFVLRQVGRPKKTCVGTEDWWRIGRRLTETLGTHSKGGFRAPETVENPSKGGESWTTISEIQVEYARHLNRRTGQILSLQDRCVDDRRISAQKSVEVAFHSESNRYTLVRSERPLNLTMTGTKEAT